MKIFNIIIILFLCLNVNSQSLYYSDFSQKSESLLKSLYQDDNYYFVGNDEYPSFQGKYNDNYIRFYKSTGVIVRFIIKSGSEYNKLINDIKNNARFEYKYCSDYNSSITYNYKTDNDNEIRFNFDEAIISVEYPSSVNSFLESNSEFTPVFVCTSNVAYAFHTNLKCQGLQNCDAKIAKTNIREAKQYNYRFCEICTDDNL